MRQSLILTIVIVTLFSGYNIVAGQNNDTAVIEGTVYDINEAVIVDVWISVENTATRELKNVLTDSTGRYRLSVPPGRYSVAIRPFPGYPLGYIHSSFFVSSGERVMVNFRPQPPYAISDSIESGHWSEKYEGPRLTHLTHFIQQRNGTIKDLRVQCVRVNARGEVFEYKYWVVASFDRLTLYAKRAVLYAKKARLLAEGSVTFEDGTRSRKANRVKIDLVTGFATVE